MDAREVGHRFVSQSAFEVAEVAAVTDRDVVFGDREEVPVEKRVALLGIRDRADVVDVFVQLPELAAGLGDVIARKELGRDDEPVFEPAFALVIGGFRPDPVERGVVREARVVRRTYRLPHHLLLFWCCAERCE